MKAKHHETPKPKLPNAEVQALADLALRAWESGGREYAEDTLGGRWLFQPVRDANTRLEITRATDDGPELVRALSARELGVAEPGPMVASVILALACPP